MKFEFGPNKAGTGMELIATPDGVLDGVPPLGRYKFDNVLRNASMDHITVAGVLLFGEFLGAELSTNGPISRQLFEALNQYFGDRVVSSERISDRPVAAWPSAGKLLVGPFTQLPARETTPPGVVHCYEIWLADSTSFNGAIGTSHQSIIASNFEVFSALNNIPRELVYIAHGVLTARELHMRTIVINGSHLSAEVQSRLQALVRAVDLNLSFLAN